MTTLTDRYVAATLRRVPEKQRPEIEKELRAAIADDTDARVENGEKPDAAEYDTLKELGDPYRLAASYTNHSLTLIGPDVYPTFVRSLRLVLGITLPILFLVLAIVSFAQHKNVFASIFGPLGSVISVGIYIAFAITVLFALVERAQTRPSADDRRLTWTPDALAVEIDPPSLSKWGDAISPLVGAIIVVAFLLIDRFSPFVKTSSGNAVSVIDQHLWSLWVPVLLTVLALDVIVEFVKVRLRTWRVGTSIAETAINLLGAVALIALVTTTRVVNPALASGVLFAPGSWLWLLVAVVIALVWLGATINLWRPSTRRPRPAS